MITLAQLREILDYDPATGLFRWRAEMGARAKIGAVAGHVKETGYRIIFILRKRYAAHRLAWFYVHGFWPNGPLDHANRDRDDNRIANLRTATRSQNQCNSADRTPNSVGARGVSRASGSSSFVARIALHGKSHHLGSFLTIAAAQEAYQTAAVALHGEFARLA